MKTSSAQQADLRGLLVDTWWYGLTDRFSEEAFRELAQLRIAQGFSAIQLVVGIPPEVGPENPNAASTAGPAWTLQPKFNVQYLRLAAARIALLNELGLRVIVYGAWGQQISWLGRDSMLAWWREIVKQLDDLDVIYCLTGESNLWIGEEDMLLPDRSTSDLWQPPIQQLPQNRLTRLARRAVRRLRTVWPKRAKSQLPQRKEAWSFVLHGLAQMTSRPLIIHTNAGETAFQVVDNPEQLAANTTQTGHSQQTRNDLWQIPIRELEQVPHQLFINLEPWYEGISDDFHAADQLYAYWVTMLAGAASCCYGAHGIWNGGDGRFLAHWGKQTFSQAMQLDTPRLLGLSHQQFLSYKELEYTSYKTQGNRLFFISRTGPNQSITFYPEISAVPGPHQGDIWLPLHGRFTSILPANGPVVLFEFTAAA